MLQLVRRKDYILGYQIRASIVFYQKTKYKWFLKWLKKEFENCGYLRDRNDGMSEYTITGIKDVRSILQNTLPFLKLKKKQAILAIEILEEMPGTGRKMNAKLLLKLARKVDRFSELNYSKRRTNTSENLISLLSSQKILDPVETDPKGESRQGG